MKRIILLIAVILLAASCNDEPKIKVKHGDKLVFTTEDTFLRDGDLVGVSMDSPLSYTNVKMTCSSGALTPTNDLYWPVDMPDSAVNFMAYYPYSAEYNNGGYVLFTASPDQSADEAFRASSLMVALAKASHTQPAVEFNFEQKMSKLVFYLRNDSGSPVKDVYLTAYPTVQFNMDKVNLRVTGEKVDIHAHLSATSADGVQAYEIIMAPQNSTLSLTIRTDAAEYTALMSTKTAFASGKQYSNVRLTVLEEGRNRPFNFAIKEADWAQTPDFDYLEPITGGAAFQDITDPGLYRLNNGIATQLRAYVPNFDQYSVVAASQKYGWRIMDLANAEMFQILSNGSFSQEGNSLSIQVSSFGLEWDEANYSSTAEVVKVENGLVWLEDQNKEYGYIIMSE